VETLNQIQSQPMTIPLRAQELMGATASEPRNVNGEIIPLELKVSMRELMASVKEAKYNHKEQIAAEVADHAKHPKVNPGKTGLAGDFLV
jgi:hypothetical protein